MRLTIKFALTAVPAVVLLTACQPQRHAPPPPRPTPPVIVDRPALAPRDYLAVAASVDLLMVKAGELALMRARDGGLRDLARTLRDDHRATAAQLSLAGRRLNLLPSATLRREHQAQLDALATSANFDADYRRVALLVHRQAHRLHSDFAARGLSPTLRPVAASAARIERAHIAALD